MDDDLLDCLDWARLSFDEGHGNVVDALAVCEDEDLIVELSEILSSVSGIQERLGKLLDSRVVEDSFFSKFADSSDEDDY